MQLRALPDHDWSDRHVLETFPLLISKPTSQPNWHTESMLTPPHSKNPFWGGFNSPHFTAKRIQVRLIVLQLWHLISYWITLCDLSIIDNSILFYRSVRTIFIIFSCLSWIKYSGRSQCGVPRLRPFYEMFSQIKSLITISPISQLAGGWSAQKLYGTLVLLTRRLKLKVDILFK